METAWIVLAGSLLGYLVGSFPTGYLLAKLKGKDIRTIGSGATGATNVARVLGRKYAGVVLAIDVSKCFVLAAIAYWRIQSDSLTVAVILAVTLGHIFPCFLRFKGGKGAATLIGGLIPLLSWMWIPMIAVWLLVLWQGRKMSLTNLVAVLFLLPLLWLAKPSVTYLSLGILAILIIYFSHRQNIARIWQGKEPNLF